MRLNRAAFHNLVRKGLALLFWLHAFGLTRLLTHIKIWNQLPQLVVIKVSLISAIIFYSYVAGSAGWSMAVDLLYVYASPIVVLGRLSWQSIKSIYRKIPLFTELELPNAQVSQKVASVETEQHVEIGKFIFRPLLHFPVLWCFLVAISNEKLILVITAIATISLACRSVYIFHNAIDGSFNDTESYKLRIKEMFENIAGEIKKTDLTEAEYKQKIFNIKLYGNLLGYVSSSKAVRKLTKRLTLAIAVPTYIYVASLCGFASYAIGKLAMINWGLSEALLNSLFMPIAYTDLPHNLIIRLLGGLQVASLLFIGYDTVFRSIDQKMEIISKNAQSLAAIFESEHIVNALKIYDAKKEVAQQ